MLSDSNHVISEDVFNETESLTRESVFQELMDSFHFSGRYWIWTMTPDYKKMEWKKMFEAGEMRIKTNGFIYLKSYPSIIAMEEAYSQLHPDGIGIKKYPPSYYAFANYLRKGDVVLATRSGGNVFCWGIVESDYLYSPQYYSAKHYRKMKWFIIDIPFTFTKRVQTIYQIPLKECSNMKEILSGNIRINKGELPFDFGNYSN